MKKKKIIQFLKRHLLKNLKYQVIELIRLLDMHSGQYFWQY